MSTRKPKIAWHIERKKVAELINFEQNYRKISEKNALDLKRSIAKFNVAAIPAINTDNTILAGHQRVAQMKLLGIEETDVLVPERKLTPTEMLKFNILANSVSGQWDYGILANANEIAELLEWGFSTIELGIEPPKLNDDGAVENMPALKQISLVYPTAEFEELVRMLTALRGEETEVSFSDLILEMINVAYYSLGEA